MLFGKKKIYTCFYYSTDLNFKCHFLQALFKFDYFPVKIKNKIEILSTNLP